MLILGREEEKMTGKRPKVAKRQKGTKAKNIGSEERRFESDLFIGAYTAFSVTTHLYIAY